MAGSGRSGGRERTENYLGTDMTSTSFLARTHRRLHQPCAMPGEKKAMSLPYVYRARATWRHYRDISFFSGKSIARKASSKIGHHLDCRPRAAAFFFTLFVNTELQVPDAAFRIRRLAAFGSFTPDREVNTKLSSAALRSCGSAPPKEGCHQERSWDNAGSRLPKFLRFRNNQ